MPRSETDTENTQKRQAELERLRRILPESEPWEKWLVESGELPPNFDAMRQIPGLPDPLRFEDGREITDQSDWPARREELLKLFHHYVLGTVPPPPTNIEGKVMEVHDRAGGSSRKVLLTFGPGRKAKLNLELLVPAGAGPFPVFLTQANHRAWAVLAVSRGYVGCVFHGSDRNDDTDSFVNVWPEYDWSKLTRRAWAAGRCIDYLETLSFVNPNQIAMTGHSRNGKQSVIAAALDDRIAAVVSSSSGTGGVGTFRMCDEAHFNESIELITGVFPDWFHPRLRFFSGREDRLPIDQNQLVALIAPRPCLISTALNDMCESAWSSQQSYLSAKHAYELLDGADNLRIRWRYGEHSTCAEDIAAYLDWFDRAFGKGKTAGPQKLVFPVFADWLARCGEVEEAAPARSTSAALPETQDEACVADLADWEIAKRAVVERVTWSMGLAPPVALNTGGKYGSERPPRELLMRHHVVYEGLAKERTNFGEYVSGDWYYPDNEAAEQSELPAAIWLHPYSYSNGYAASYLRCDQPYMGLAKAGFAALAYDQIGFGHRIEECSRFYDRHPRWSLLGKMVRDASAAVDEAIRNPKVDSDRIYLVGFALGATVALHSAALDKRVAGVVAIGGLAPLGAATDDLSEDCLDRLANIYMLQPRLARYIGDAAQLPYDCGDLVSLIAPRPAILVAPQLDRYAAPVQVDACVAQAGKIYELYGATGMLIRESPDDYLRITQSLQESVWKALGELAGL